MQGTFSAEPERWAQHQVDPQVPAVTPPSLQSCSCPISLLDWELQGGKPQLGAEDEEIGADRWGKQGQSLQELGSVQGCDWGFAVQLAADLPAVFSNPKVFPGWEHPALHSIWNQADITLRESQTWCHQNTAWSNQANVEFCLASLSGLSTVWKKKKTSQNHRWLILYLKGRCVYTFRKSDWANL